MTDAGLRELAALNDLATLGLSCPDVTDAGLKELAACKKLKSLDLTDTHVTDAGLRELAALRNLATLDLSGTHVTDAGLKQLAPLKNLSTLNLGSGPLTDAGLKVLREINLLHALTQASANGARPIKAEDVTSFRLIGSDFDLTDVGLKELTAFTNLTHLDFDDRKVTAAGLCVGRPQETDLAQLE